MDKVTKHHTLQILEGKGKQEFRDLTFNKRRGRTGKHCWEGEEEGEGEGEGRGRGGEGKGEGKGEGEGEENFVKSMP